MKNLFQNKKILFTLILIASCFGILGVGGEGKAVSCSDYFCFSSMYCSTGTEICRDLSEAGVCPTSSNRCLAGTAKEYKIKCDGNCECKAFTLINKCADYCCQIANEGNKDYKCNKKGECVLTGKCTEECVDISKCVGNFNVVTDGPTICPDGLVCVKKGSCKTETTAGCDCKSSCTFWVTDSECGERGCKASEKYQIRDCAWNGCKSGDCDIKQCKYFSDCKTTIPNPCYWINIGCNPDDECDNQEAEICGPSNCKGNCDGKSRGSTRCVFGSDCNENSGGGNSGGSGGYTPDTNGGAVRFTNPLSTESFEALIMGIINWILGIVVSLAILFLIIGGLMYITSAGDEERIKKAKNIILYAIVGLGVVILSWSIITELKDILGVK